MVKRRGYTPKRRNTHRRQMKRVLLLSVEGNKRNKTEKAYFQHFNDGDMEVRFVSGNETDPEMMMRRLIDAYEEYDLGAGDYAACLVDADFFPRRNSQLKKSDSLAKKFRQENLKLIVSAPSFEIWFICHFKYSTSQYQNKEEVLKTLSQCIGKEYKKSDDLYPQLAGKEKTAVGNARRLEGMMKDSGKILHEVDFSPSTEVYKIFEGFILPKQR